MKTILLISSSNRVAFIGAGHYMRTLRKNGYRCIYLTYENNYAVSLADSYYISQQSIFSYEQIRDIVESEKVEYIHHMSDWACEAVGRVNEEFGLPGPSQSQFKALNDKQYWSSLAEQGGIEVPQEWLITKKSDLDLDKWNFPFIVKPAESSASTSDKPYGYKFFENLECFKLFLESKDLVQDFIQVNNVGSQFGKYFLQEKLHYKECYVVNLVIVDGRVVFSEADYHSVPESLTYLRHKLYGPVELPKPFKETYEKVVSILLNDVKLKYARVGFDIIEDQYGRFVVPEVNTRSGMTFTSSLSYRDSEEFVVETVRGLMGDSHTVPEKLKPFARQHLYFKPGVIESVSWYDANNRNVEIFGRAHCEPGTLIPEENTEGWPVGVFASANSLEECFDICRKAKEETVIEYA